MEYYRNMYHPLLAILSGPLVIGSSVVGVIFQNHPKVRTQNPEAKFPANLEIET